MKKLRTALVGMGRIGWDFHAPEIQKHAGFEFVAVVDPIQERLDESRERFGVAEFLDYEQMLDETSPDLVVITSPTHFHARQVIVAFERGVDVFCDKPLTPDLAETDRVISAMKAHKRKLMVFQPYRTRPEFIALREIISQGIIGPVFMVKYYEGLYRRRNDWQAFKKFGGGVLTNFAAHSVDALLNLVASPSQRVRCATRRIVSLGDAEDMFKMIIETEDDTILDIDTNMASARTIEKWHILGKYGEIVLEEIEEHEDDEIDPAEQTLHLRYFDPEKLAEISASEDLAVPDRRYGTGEIIPWQEKEISLGDYPPIDFYQKCYEYFAQNALPFIPIEETREVMRVLELCRADAKK
ncbi:MAG TPA: Gfo/Idh/MocA family oxidoreductase [Anaerolineales bacterium]|nr:Gfo/Idh/MocA family oxidoreductase [Anaerolineales bacterium]